MQLVELDLNPHHPQAVYQSQKGNEEVSVKTAGLAQLSLASRTGKEALGAAMMAPPFLLGHSKVPQLAPPDAPIRAGHAAE